MGAIGFLSGKGSNLFFIHKFGNKISNIFNSDLRKKISTKSHVQLAMRKKKKHQANTTVYLNEVQTDKPENILTIFADVFFNI